MRRGWLPPSPFAPPSGRRTKPSPVPARRATETVAALGLDASSCAALADVDHGRWAGRAFAEVATAEPEAVAAWLGDPDAAPHGGESLAALLARTRAWLQTLHAPAGARRHRVLAVTHAAVIRALVVQTLGAPPAAFWRIDVAPLTLTILRGEAERWTLAALGTILRT